MSDNKTRADELAAGRKAAAQDGRVYLTFLSRNSAAIVDPGLKINMHRLLGSFSPDYGIFEREFSIDTEGTVAKTYNNFLAAAGRKIEIVNAKPTLTPVVNDGITLKKNGHGKSMHCTLSFTPDAYMSICARWDYDPTRKLSPKDLQRWPQIKAATQVYIPPITQPDGASR